MPILQTFTSKEVVALVPGELFVMDLGLRALCLTMQRNDTDQIVQAVVLSSHEDRVRPYWMPVRFDTDCLSYGTDWILDLEDGLECCPGDYNTIDTTGTILVSPAGRLLRVDGDGNMPRARTQHFDLDNFCVKGRGSDVSSTLTIRRWRIWLNEEQRTRIGGEPIFEFHP